MDRLLAQAAICELLAEYDSLATYAARTNGSGLYPWEAAEQAQVESAASAYLASAHVVARYFGIKLRPQVEG